jgi:putative transposase
MHNPGRTRVVTGYAVKLRIIARNCRPETNLAMQPNETHRRRSLRLQGYDYAQAGAYFVTICTQDRKCLFGEVADGAMRLNDAGHMAAAVWSNMLEHFPKIELDMFVVMPNHLHGIIVLSEDRGSLHVQGGHEGRPYALGDGTTMRKAPTIGDIVGAFKSLATLQFVEGVKNERWQKFDRRVWQRNYYEHVIRDERDLNRVRRYIDENPLRWEFDQENPQRRTP